MQTNTSWHSTSLSKQTYSMLWILLAVHVQARSRLLQKTEKGKNQGMKCRKKPNPPLLPSYPQNVSKLIYRKPTHVPRLYPPFKPLPTTVSAAVENTPICHFRAIREQFATKWPTVPGFSYLFFKSNRKSRFSMLQCQKAERIREVSIPI